MSNPFTIDGEDSNPFADQNTATGSRYGYAPPAPITHHTPEPTASPYGGAPSFGGQGYGNASNSAAKSLAEREAELNRREAMLNQREVQVEKKEALMEGYNPPNFPPCKPLVYHDIEKDIPQEGKWIVKRIYYHWLFSVLNYLINAITGFILLVNKAESAGGNFGAALIMLVAITPVSFVFWYQPLYNGVKRNRSVQFFLFQFNYIAHIGLAGLMSAGIPGWGGAGIIYCISNIGSNIGLGVMCAITSAGFIYQVVYGMWQVKAVRSYYMARGMNAEEAKQQALTGVAQSGLGKEIIKTAIRTQV